MTVAALFVACSPQASAPQPAAEKPLWLRSSAEPYPFTTPIPELDETEIDGTYVRRIPPRIAGDSVKCRRCAPYRIEIGTTTLELEEGRYHVSHIAPGKPDSSQFRSAGHFVLDKSLITLFNDANCPQEQGVYRWAVTGERLTLEEVDDPCPYSDLRKRFLEATSWDMEL